MRPLLLSTLVLLPFAAQAAEKTRPLPLAKLAGLRIWDQGYLATKRGPAGTVTWAQQIQFKNETRHELAALIVRPILHLNGRNWRGKPVRVTNLSNSDVPYDGSLLPMSKSNPQTFSVSVPEAQLRVSNWHEMELVGAEEYVDPDLHNLGHLYTWMINGTSSSVIALFKKDPSLLKLRAPSGLTTTLAAFAATDGPTMKWILAHGGDPKTRTVRGSTAMHLAAINRSGGVLELALGPGGGVNVRATSGRTPLMKAIHVGNPTGWRWLLKHGADPNLGDKEGGTPASYAIVEGQIPAIDDLVRAGVNPKKLGPRGYGWMHYGLSNYLMFDKIRSLGVPVDQKGPGGITPLMMAVESGFEIHKVTWLLVHGADPYLKDKKGRSALAHFNRASPGNERFFLNVIRRYPKGTAAYTGR